MTLLQDVERYLVKTGWPATKFGRAAANDPALVGQMRKGRVPSPQMEAKIRAFISGVSIHALDARPRRARSAAKGTRTTVVGRPKPEPIADDQATAIMKLAGPQSPGEAIALVKARWPETWARLVAVGRSRRIAPGALMIELIEHGLDA